jgi:hypothetical protein
LNGIVFRCRFFFVFLPANANNRTYEQNHIYGNKTIYLSGAFSDVERPEHPISAHKGACISGHPLKGKKS